MRRFRSGFAKCDFAFYRARKKPYADYGLGGAGQDGKAGPETFDFPVASGKKPVATFRQNVEGASDSSGHNHARTFAADFAIGTGAGGG